jgi:hypothetical protein
MGNHPTKDIMVSSPNDVAFGVDVKGLYKRNYWAVRPKPERADVFYVFALVPDAGQNRFFVLTQAEVNEGIEADLARARQSATAKGRAPESIADFPGVAWSYAEKFEDRWDKLPT